jgi:hypothetical protein
MTCIRCASENQSELPADVTLCFDTFSQPFTDCPVCFTGRALACLDCGFSEVIIPEAALLLLKQTIPHSQRLETPAFTDR